ncbi:hypothetical protein, partial [Rhodovulum sulfidophilum]|uniref:hypothetical protein n=1 Tax=Rhodovulum sulfidophilum TaxID=35806 RepID=UPI001C4A78BC
PPRPGAARRTAIRPARLSSLTERHITPAPVTVTGKRPCRKMPHAVKCIANEPLPQKPDLTYRILIE